MDLDELISALEAPIEQAEQLKSKRYDCPELKRWKASTKSLIRRTDEPDFLDEFNALRFRSAASHLDASAEIDSGINQPIYEDDLTAAQEILRALIEDLQARKKPALGFLKEHRPRLSGHQRDLWEALQEVDEGLGSMYHGALITLSGPLNPERLSQAAHSLRELLDNLPRYCDVPDDIEPHSQLKNKVIGLQGVWRKFTNAWSSPGTNRWEGEIDGSLGRFLRACERFFVWFADSFLLHRERVVSVLRSFDPGGMPMPATLEDQVFDEWKRLRDFFLDVLHHRVTPNEVELKNRLADLEAFLLERLRPRTFADFEDLDQIIEEGESHA